MWQHRGELGFALFSEQASSRSSDRVAGMAAPAAERCGAAGPEAFCWVIWGCTEQCWPCARCCMQASHWGCFMVCSAGSGDPEHPGCPHGCSVQREQAWAGRARCFGVAKMCLGRRQKQKSCVYVLSEPAISGWEWGTPTAEARTSHTNSTGSSFHHLCKEMKTKSGQWVMASWCQGSVVVS